MKMKFQAMRIVSSLVMMAGLICGVWGELVLLAQNVSEKPSAVSEASPKPQLPYCSVCGKRCTGRYMVLRNEKFCSSECIGTKFSCASCGVTLGVGENTAFSTLKDIQEKELLFCGACMEKPSCTFCGSRKETALLPDKRISCATCRSLAVFKTEDARSILTSVQKMLAERFGFPVDPDIPLKVLPYEEFHQHRKDYSSSSEALAFHLTEVSGHTWLSDDGKTLYVEMDTLDSGMLVLEGAPGPLVFDAIAHELTHEFLRRKFYHFEDPKIEEGFCESIAAACSIFNGHPSLALRRIGNPDPVYGDGFRLIYPMLQDQGWEAVMEFLGKNSQPMKEYVRAHIYEMLDAETAEFIRKKKLRPKLKFGKIPKH
ncbi:MAG: protein DA1 [Planctomycetaceae bacterium]|nr:protein DA1 [Planctomycetaceae bacterium]